MAQEKKMYVVFCEDDGTYWCSYNTWSDQLRKATVFHSLKYLDEVHKRFKELKLKNMELRMEVVPENQTNADRIRAMSDDELATTIHAISLGWKGEWCDYHCENQGDDGCDKCVEKWLKQPAKENE